MTTDAAELAVLAHKVAEMHSDFGEIRTVLRELTQAINKLALVEERQTQLAVTQERAFKALERLETKFDALEKRVNTLEADEPMQKQTSAWVLAGVWGFAGIAASFFFYKFLAR